jgi:hypothetical protein
MCITIKASFSWAHLRSVHISGIEDAVTHALATLMPQPQVEHGLRAIGRRVGATA